MLLNSFCELVEWMGNGSSICRRNIKYNKANLVDVECEGFKFQYEVAFDSSLYENWLVYVLHVSRALVQPPTVHFLT